MKIQHSRLKVLWLLKGSNHFRMWLWKPSRLYPRCIPRLLELKLGRGLKRRRKKRIHTGRHILMDCQSIMQKSTLKQRQSNLNFLSLNTCTRQRSTKQLKKSIRLLWFYSNRRLSPKSSKWSNCLNSSMSLSQKAMAKYSTSTNLKNLISYLQST